MDDNKRLEKEMLDIVIKPNEPQLLAVTVDMTDEQLLEGVWKSYIVCDLTHRGFGLTISGYDDDPRELFEIPEVVKFCRRILNLGFMSILEVSTQSPELKSEDSWGLGFGALEIWCIARNLVTTGEAELTKEQIGWFLSDLDKSNTWLKRMMDKPQAREVKDGQHRLNFRWN